MDGVHTKDHFKGQRQIRSPENGNAEIGLFEAGSGSIEMTDYYVTDRHRHAGANDAAKSQSRSELFEKARQAAFADNLRKIPKLLQPASKAHCRSESSNDPGQFSQVKGSRLCQQVRLTAAVFLDPDFAVKHLV